jgi:hypothetical protein
VANTYHRGTQTWRKAKWETSESLGISQTKCFVFLVEGTREGDGSSAPIAEIAVIARDREGKNRNTYHGDTEEKEIRFLGVAVSEFAQPSAAAGCAPWINQGATSAIETAPSPAG